MDMRTRTRPAGHGRGGRSCFVGVVLGAAALMAAACGSGGASSAPSTTGTTSAATATTAGAAVVRAQRGSLGTVVVDQSGMTLYRFTPDGTGKTTCTDSCATTWLPATVPAGTTRVVAGPGISGGELGTITRPDGTLQVTFNGMPLYRYSADSKPGDATGQGLNGVWFVVPASSGASGSTTTTASSGGYRY